MSKWWVHPETDERHCCLRSCGKALHILTSGKKENLRYYCAYCYKELKITQIHDRILRQMGVRLK